MAKPASVEDYLAALPDGPRAAVDQLRAAIAAAAPAAVEVISYGIPTFELGGRLLVSCAAFKHHASLFPASGMVLEALGDAVRPYLAGKATLRFPADQSIPADLVRDVVRLRVQELASRNPGRGPVGP